MVRQYFKQHWHVAGYLLALTLSSASAAPAASPLTAEDQELIARSRELIRQADATLLAPVSDGVSNPALPESPPAALLPGKDQGQTLSADHAPTPQGTRWLLFASLSLGDNALKSIFREAAAADMTVVFRGIPEGMTLGQGIRHLHRLLADLDPLPSVILDPESFRAWVVSTVPQVVQLQDGVLIVRAAGISSRDWLQQRSDAGARGDLGTWGPVVIPTEQDLLETLQARIGGLDLSALKEQALANFWSRQTFTDLPVATHDHTQWLDPTTAMQAALRDAEGKALVPAGTRINPLSHLRFRQALVVFDARDSRQRKRVEDWLASHPAAFSPPSPAPVADDSTDTYATKYSRITLVTTGIQPSHGWQGWAALEKQFARPVYLLNTTLQSRFQLREVPAVIDAVGERVRVRYLAVPERGTGI
jgi:conjugal transfer pilus assembly protein TraW